MALACAGKMVGAVALGHVLSALPPRVISGLTAATFAGTAIALWRQRPGAPLAPDAPEREPPRARNGLLVTFASLFFTEWGDLGQITAASLAARSGQGIVVWAAGTAALLTKGALALPIGRQLRRFLPARLMTTVAVALCLAMAVIAVVRPER